MSPGRREGGRKAARLEEKGAGPAPAAHAARGGGAGREACLRQGFLREGRRGRSGFSSVWLGSRGGASWPSAQPSGGLGPGPGSLWGTQGPSLASSVSSPQGRLWGGGVVGMTRSRLGRGPATPPRIPGAQAAVTHISAPAALCSCGPGISGRWSRFPVLLPASQEAAWWGASSPPPPSSLSPFVRPPRLACLLPGSPRARRASAPTTPGLTCDLAGRAPAWAGRGPVSQAQRETETKADLEGGTHQRAACNVLVFPGSRLQQDKQIYFQRR